METIFRRLKEEKKPVLARNDAGQKPDGASGKTDGGEVSKSTQIDRIIPNTLRPLVPGSANLIGTVGVRAASRKSGI